MKRVRRGPTIRQEQDHGPQAVALGPLVSPRVSNARFQKRTVTHCGCARRTRGGFTVLELLLATAFGAMLLAGVWSLFRTYERMFTAGESRSEETQLVHAVLAQLAEDLTSAIADHAASLSSGPAPLRRFGLLGSSQSLQVDVLRSPPVEPRFSAEDESAPGQNRSAMPRVPELHTVQWRFSSPALGSGAGQTRLGRPTWSGLLRRELDWETPVSAGPPGSASRGIGRLRMKFRFSRAERSSRAKTDDAIDVDLDDPAVFHVPEVVEARFRYFDGQGFSDEWNSLSRKSLPMAVEIVLQFRSGLTAASQKAAATMVGTRQAHNQTAIDTSRPRDESEDSQADSQTHRLLVYLPTTSLARRVGAERLGRTLEIPAPVYRPRPLPLPPPRESSSERASGLVVPADQWMRAGQ